MNIQGLIESGERMQSGEVSAAILAGGLSSRMGRDKASLRLGGKTLIEHQTEKLERIGIRDIMLSGWTERRPGTRTIPDVYPHGGPLSGLHACLRTAIYPACLVVSVDLPLISENTLSALISAHSGGITALRHGDRLEPLAAVYDCRLFLEAEKILLSERRAVMRLMDCCPVREVLYSGDESFLINCNTPKDFERIEALWMAGIF